MCTVNLCTPFADNPFPRLIPRNRLLYYYYVQHRRTPNTRFTDPFFHARTHTHTHTYIGDDDVYRFTILNASDLPPPSSSPEVRDVSQWSDIQFQPDKM